MVHFGCKQITHMGIFEGPLTDQCLIFAQSFSSLRTNFQKLHLLNFEVDANIFEFIYCNIWNLVTDLSEIVNEGLR